jgi:hypothetical protein
MGGQRGIAALVDGADKREIAGEASDRVAPGTKKAPQRQVTLLF